MNEIKRVLIEQFGVDCIGIGEVHGGLSAMNYKIVTDGQPFFLKVYDKSRAQSSQWTQNIDRYMPVLVWLNENTGLRGRIVRPLKTKAGDFCFEDSENVFLLFDYIEGETAGKALTHAQILEAAETMACLHSCEGPALARVMREDFAIPFCRSLERFIAQDYAASPPDVRAILQPCLARLMAMCGELKSLAQKVKQKDFKAVLCHTDAHGYNLMQGERLILVDWEGMKLAPAEADLFMFSKREYWDTFLRHYLEKRPGFVLDEDIYAFYILRRKIEDIWEFVQGIVYENLPAELRQRDLAHLANCCDALCDLCFAL